MSYFPALLNIDYKKVVIVGGGHVARQKVEALLPTKAHITIVSPVINEDIENYVQQGKCTWLKKTFEPKDVDDATLIFAVTDDEQVNDAVEEATQHWQLLSRADAKGRVDFINPAVVRREDFIVTVSTSGASPGLTRKVKLQLAGTFDEHYGPYVAFLKQARKHILANLQGEAKKEAIASLLDPRILDWIREGNEEACQQFLQTILGETK